MSSVKNLGHTGERQGSRKCKWLRRNKKGIFMVRGGGNIDDSSIPESEQVPPQTKHL
jgi:hypothetical protein